MQNRICGLAKKKYYGVVCVINLNQYGVQISILYAVFAQHIYYDIWQIAQPQLFKILRSSNMHLGIRLLFFLYG